MAKISEYLPPVAFYYALTIDGESKVDSGFQEVSGLTLDMKTETIQDGGENRFVHKVPGRVTYEDLVLKRGLITSTSSLAQWIHSHLSGNLASRVEPKNVSLQLLDANQQTLLQAWHFVNAFPTSWSLSSMEAQGDALAVESLTLTYSYFWVESEGRRDQQA